MLLNQMHGCSHMPAKLTVASSVFYSSVLFTTEVPQLYQPLLSLSSFKKVACDLIVSQLQGN